MLASDCIGIDIEDCLQGLLNNIKNFNEKIEADLLLVNKLYVNNNIRAEYTKFREEVVALLEGKQIKHTADAKYLENLVKSYEKDKYKDPNKYEISEEFFQIIDMKQLEECMKVVTAKELKGLLDITTDVFLVWVQLRKPSEEEIQILQAEKEKVNCFQAILEKMDVDKKLQMDKIQKMHWNRLYGTTKKLYELLEAKSNLIKKEE